MRRDEDDDDEREVKRPRRDREREPAKGNPVMIGVMIGVPILLVVLACGGLVWVGKKGPAPAAPSDQTPAQPATGPQAEYALGEFAEDGDLRFTLTDARVDQVGGQYNGRYRSIKVTTIRVVVENKSAGKIVEWQGWHGKAKVEDEHGNGFPALNLSSWSGLPDNNDPAGEPAPGDTGITRIEPGKTYKDALYYDSMPKTSNRIIVSVPYRGHTLRFTGTVKHPGR